MSEEVRENELVRSLAGGLPRSPQQGNRLGESDAELLPLPGLHGRYLAITVDALVEELETGLYRDPYQIGWMAVMSSASDLAAVGADPLGILLSETVPIDAGGVYLERLQLGVRDACALCGMYVLGGDTNRSAHPHVESTAIGIVPIDQAMLRSGCRPGHRLFASGPLGAGNAYALEVLTRPAERPEVSFLPAARTRESRLLRRYASSCMDSSDGAFATLDEIMRRSTVGFRIDVAVERLLDPAARRIAEKASLPAWMLLAGPHGEFELIFTVPPHRCPAFLTAAGRTGWRPVFLGEARSTAGLELMGDGELHVDGARIRNAAERAASDIDGLVEELLASVGA